MMYLTGDSHVHALRMGAQALAEQGEIPRDTRIRIGMHGNAGYFRSAFSEVRHGRVALTHADGASLLERLTGERYFIADRDVSYGLSMGFHTAPAFRHPVWQRYRPTELVTWRGQHVISDGVLDAIVDHQCRHVFRFFEQLAENEVSYFVIASPPPRSDHRCLAQTPAEVVLAVDRRFRSRVCGVLAGLGVRVVPPPEQAFDPAGFLRPEFNRRAPNDFHHANGSYGELMMRSILQLASTTTATASAAAPASQQAPAAELELRATG